MKSFLFTLSGLCAAAVCFMVWPPRKDQPVEALAHRLEEAWSDHHTVA